MAPIRSRMDTRAAVDGDPGEAGAPAVAVRRQGGETAAREKTRLSDAEARADAIARAEPFSAWPRDALLRLAAAARVYSHRAGTTILFGGQRCDAITVSVEGSVIASVTSPGGRRLIFKFDDGAYAYGLAPLIDGQTPPHDVLADGPVTVVRMPYTAIRAELVRLPALWESIAVEVNRRGLGLNRQVQQFVFDAPLVRAAALLLGMLVTNDQDGEPGPVDIGLRLPQERLAELLGTSRQWATAMVRELSTTGIVEWRYGRVTVLDVQALRRLASTGIDTLGQQSLHQAPRRQVDRAT
jgi:CRP/FNR family cyclic AMP-dependent transcriptional regulator